MISDSNRIVHTGEKHPLGICDARSPPGCAFRIVLISDTHSCHAGGFFPVSFSILRNLGMPLMLHLALQPHPLAHKCVRPTKHGYLIRICPCYHCELGAIGHSRTSLFYPILLAHLECCLVQSNRLLVRVVHLYCDPLPSHESDIPPNK